MSTDQDDLDTSIGGAADRAWFAKSRARIRANQERTSGHPDVVDPIVADDLPGLAPASRAALIAAFWGLIDQSDQWGAEHHATWSARLKDPDLPEDDRRRAREKIWMINLVRHGLHSGACTIAGMLGVRACDIERPA